MLSYRHLRRAMVALLPKPQDLYHPSVLPLFVHDRDPFAKDPLPSWHTSLSKITPAWTGAALHPLEPRGVLSESPSLATVRFVVKMPYVKGAKAGEWLASKEIVLAHLFDGTVTGAVHLQGGDGAMECKAIMGAQLVVRHSDLSKPGFISATMQFRSKGTCSWRCVGLRVGIVDRGVARARNDLFHALNDFCDLDVLMNSSCKSFDVEQNLFLNHLVWETLAHKSTAESDLLLPDGTLTFWGQLDLAP